MDSFNTKILLNFKTPDVLFYACERLHKEQHDRAHEVMVDALGSTECVNIEIDLITGEARILKR